MSETVNNSKAVGNGLTVFSRDRSGDMGIAGAAWGFEGVGIVRWRCFAFLCCWRQGLVLEEGTDAQSRCSQMHTTSILPGVQCFPHHFHRS